MENKLHISKTSQNLLRHRRTYSVVDIGNLHAKKICIFGCNKIGTSPQSRYDSPRSLINNLRTAIGGEAVRSPFAKVALRIPKANLSSPKKSLARIIDPQLLNTIASTNQRPPSILARAKSSKRGRRKFIPWINGTKWSEKDLKINKISNIAVRHETFSANPTSFLPRKNPKVIINLPTIGTEDLRQSKTSKGLRRSRSTERWGRQIYATAEFV